MLVIFLEARPRKGTRNDFLASKTFLNGQVITYLDPSLIYYYVMVRPLIKDLLAKFALHPEELVAQNLQQSDFRLKVFMVKLKQTTMLIPALPVLIVSFYSSLARNVTYPLIEMIMNPSQMYPLCTLLRHGNQKKRVKSTFWCSMSLSGWGTQWITP